MLDELVAVTGWSRANARRAITRATKRRGTARSVQRKPRARTYGYDTLKVLIEVWTLIGQPCGKYLEPIMAPTVAQLEAFGELGKVADRLSPAVREQSVAMSPATIDRLLKPTKQARYPAAKSATRPGRHAAFLDRGPPGDGVVALGIGIDGTKHPLGLVEGSTENTVSLGVAGLGPAGRVDVGRPALVVTRDTLGPLGVLC